MYFIDPSPVNIEEKKFNLTDYKYVEKIYEATCDRPADRAVS